MIIQLPTADPALAGLGLQLRRVREARGFDVHRLAGETQIAASRLGLAEQGRARLTSAELHAVIGALHITLGLLHAPDVDVRMLRPL